MQAEIIAFDQVDIQMWIINEYVMWYDAPTEISIHELSDLTTEPSSPSFGIS